LQTVVVVAEAAAATAVVAAEAAAAVVVVTDLTAHLGGRLTVNWHWRLIAEAANYDRVQETP